MLDASPAILKKNTVATVGATYMDVDLHLLLASGTLVSCHRIFTPLLQVSAR